MADYNLSNFRNYTIFTDQTGSAIYDTGGPTGSYATGENYYFEIAPSYSTGSLVITVESASLNTTDKIRIYNGVPTTGTTASFNYTSNTTGSQLIAVISGSSGVARSFTASAGVAYVRFSGDTNGTAGAAAGFKISWTGSGFSIPDTSSGVTFNKYGVTFPVDATSGSYMTFARGMLSSSSTVAANKDIIIGFWAKQDLLPASAPEGPVLGIGTTNGGTGISVSRQSSPSPTDSNFRIFYYDSSGSVSTLSLRSLDIVNGGQLNLFSYPPQWNHYGFVIRKIGANTGQYLAYKDGVLFNSSSITKATNWGFVTSSNDIVLGSYRDFTTGLILSGGVSKANWSGSLDDVFFAVANSGSVPSEYNTLFSRIYNSGSWSDPNTVISGAISASLNPIVVFNWRFEETGSLLNTKDYGYYGNYHTASATGNIANQSVRLTFTGSGVSYTPYASLAYSASVQPGTFNWETTNVSVYETASFATVNLIRTSGSYGNVTASIFYSSSQGTLTPPTGSGQVYFSGSQTVAQVPFFILDDLIDEPDDPIYVTIPSFITDGGTAYTGSNGTLILTIIDNETGSISFTTGSDSVYENTSSYYVGVQRLYGGDQTATASISYGGDAAEFIDYTLTYNGVVQNGPFNITWADQDSTTKYITASIFDNTYEEFLPKDIIFGIYSATNASIGPTASFQLNILDYEEGYASIQSSTYSIGEGDGFVNISVQRLSGSDGPLSVDYSTQDGTALSGTNYTYTNGTLTWEDGVTTNQAFQVPILYDGIQTANLNFKVNLSNLSTGSYSSYPTAITSSTVTITDQEPGTFRLSSSAYNVIEGQSVTVTVERYSGSYSTVNVNVRTDDDTAIQNVDYNPVNQNLTFSDSETSKTFTITTIENSTNITTPKFFTTYINSVNASDGTAFIGLPYIATVTIIDNESGSVRFDASSYTGSQNSSITISVERYSGGDFAATASVYVSASSTAVAGIDYTNIFPYTLNWADQESGSKNITITTLGPWSPSRILNLYLSDLTNIASGTIMSSSILIQSNVITQSTNQYSDYATDFTINKYLNLSNQYTRRTQQVPFSLGTNPLVRLQQAYTSST